MTFYRGIVFCDINNGKNADICVLAVCRSILIMSNTTRRMNEDAIIVLSPHL